MKNIKYILSLIFIVQLTFSQNIKVSGIVKDENNQLFFGAIVKVKGTKNYTHTDFDGKFEINTEKKAKIIISFIGYEPIEIKIKDKNYFEVNLVLAKRKISRSEKRMIRREIRKNGSYVFPD